MSIPKKLQPLPVTPAPQKGDDLADLKKSGIHPKDGDYTANSFGGKAHPPAPTPSNEKAPVRDDLK